RRGARAAGCDLGGAASHQQFARRFGVGFPGHAGQCGAHLRRQVFGQMYLRDGDAFRAVATHNAPPAYVEARSRDQLFRPPPDVPLGRVVITKQAAQIADITTALTSIAIRLSSPLSISAATGLCSWSRCSRGMSWSAQSLSRGRKSGYSPISRSTFSVILPNRPLSPSRTPACYCSASPRSSVRWRSSFSRRVFSMAIKAWLAKLMGRWFCLSVINRQSCVGVWYRSEE